MICGRRITFAWRFFMAGIENVDDFHPSRVLRPLEGKLELVWILDRPAEATDGAYNAQGLYAV
jgi:hypothetical protein